MVRNPFIISGFVSADYFVTDARGTTTKIYDRFLGIWLIENY